jgi:hypothetical protein
LADGILTISHRLAAIPAIRARQRAVDDDGDVSSMNEGDMSVVGERQKICDGLCGILM